MNNGIGAINPNAIKQVKQMMSALQNVANPQAVIEKVAQTNPQLYAVLQMCNGKSPKSVFYEQCNKMGISPDSVLSLLK